MYSIFILLLYNYFHVLDCISAYTLERTLFFVIRSLKLCLHIMLMNYIAKFLNVRVQKRLGLMKILLLMTGFDRITEDSDHLLRWQLKFYLNNYDLQHRQQTSNLRLFWLFVQTVKEVLPSMIARKCGHIVIISSMAGKSSTHLLTDYWWATDIAV